MFKPAGNKKKKQLGAHYVYSLFFIPKCLAMIILIFGGLMSNRAINLPTLCLEKEGDFLGYWQISQKIKQTKATKKWSNNLHNFEEDHLKEEEERRV